MKKWKNEKMKKLIIGSIVSLPVYWLIFESAEVALNILPYIRVKHRVWGDHGSNNRKVRNEKK